MNQLVHLILRNALDGCEDPYVLRAGECFFRAQKASLREGTLMLADLELIEGFEEERATLMATSPLAAMMGSDAAASLDVMTEATAQDYWSRSDAFAMAMNWGGDPRCRDALARVVETFLHHMLGLEVAVEPKPRIEDADWRWYVPLDAEATRIGDALWKGEAVDPTDAARVLGLFEMRVSDEARLDRRVAGRPIYLLAALTPDMTWRIKPQNLIAGLPLKRGS